MQALEVLEQGAEVRHLEDAVVRRGQLRVLQPPGVLVRDEDSTQAGPPLTVEVRSIADMEKQALLCTLRQLNGDKLTAARLLGIGKTTLYRKLKEYGVSDADLHGPA